MQGSRDLESAAPQHLPCSTPPAGSYVTHETKHFIYFYLGEQQQTKCVLIWTRMGQRAARAA